MQQWIAGDLLGSAEDIERRRIAEMSTAHRSTRSSEVQYIDHPRPLQNGAIANMAMTVRAGERMGSRHGVQRLELPPQWRRREVPMVAPEATAPEAAALADSVVAASPETNLLYHAYGSPSCPRCMEVSWSDTPQANLLHAPAAAHSESAAETEAGAPTPTQSGGQRRTGQVAGAVAAPLTTALLFTMLETGATTHSPAHQPATTTAQSPALSLVRGGGGGDEGGGGDDDRTAVPPAIDHTARVYAPLATARYACLALFMLPTIAQHNFDLRCQAIECLLLCGVLWLVRWSAAPTADRMQRRAQWLLSLLRPHIAACVLLLSRLWYRDWWGVTGVAVWFWAQGHRASTLATLAPRSCSWFERAQPWVRGLTAVIAYAEHAPTAPTTVQLRVLELQLLWEMTEFLVLRLLLRAVHWARTRLLRSLARRLDLDETEATRAD